ncbi:hypothetical protein [Planobispora takensis]|uniref:Uncharacterized protein n=1 Tax=Planobispora takensis TaxID=1367882 RepID=A0A8J3WY33_9ACTN|nr:hypothetical protein [Planobispora takensis]GII05920.1 hypothetical protein Pta02_79280 [Planobispora takensis]
MDITRPGRPIALVILLLLVFAPAVPADDGNPYTRPDPGWQPRAGSPGSSPEWISEHSSYSGAAATVLAGFLCADAIAFSLTADGAPGGAARSYPGFSAAAAEAGRCPL